MCWAKHDPIATIGRSDAIWGGLWQIAVENIVAQDPVEVVDLLQMPREEPGMGGAEEAGRILLGTRLHHEVADDAPIVPSPVALQLPDLFLDSAVRRVGAQRASGEAPGHGKELLGELQIEQALPEAEERGRIGDQAAQQLRLEIAMA